MTELTVIRSISEEVFHRPHQIELAQAVAAADSTFEAAEVIDAARQRALAEGLAPPSPSSARKNLRKLISLRVVDHVQSTATGTPGIWTRRPSAFWRWLDELPSRVES